jgi:hypothetical protein
MKSTTLPRWITLSEASLYSGFTSEIIYEALWKDQLVTNLVFRSRGGKPERLIDRHSLDEWCRRSPKVHHLIITC